MNHKTRINKYERSEIIQSMCPKYSKIKTQYLCEIQKNLLIKKVNNIKYQKMKFTNNCIYNNIKT